MYRRPQKHYIHNNLFSGGHGSVRLRFVHGTVQAAPVVRRFLRERVFSVVQCILAVSVPEKQFRQFQFCFRFLENGSDGSGLRFRSVPGPFCILRVKCSCQVTIT